MDETSELRYLSRLGAHRVHDSRHYAFRQEGLDWQIWIQSGDYPLPRKIVITTLTDEARPQYRSVYTWNLAPSYNDAAFTFDPPKDAQKIVFSENTETSRR